MSTLLIRSARPDDAPALTRLGREVFVHTFVEDFSIPYPAEDLARYLDSSFDVSSTVERLADPGQAWWVAEREGRLVGFANAGPNTLPHEDARASHAELRRLYLAREVQGMGLGVRFMDTVLPWMEAHTDGPLWIGVWSGNHRAQRLYARYGFRVVGGYRYPVGSWFDDEYILRRD
ncbi:MAG TPA: GNAT family N-acetyltransferase [Myxococcaceae bacterium]|nr:GNAT family N-acetyltransferase [Myxococcaceae bacterium]